MTTNTMVAIQTVTLGSSQSSITFGTGGTIPQNYTDLYIVANALSSSTQNDLRIQFNGDTTNNYSETHLRGNGSTATSVRESSQTSAGMGWTDSTVLSSFLIQVMNYTNSTTYKTVLSRYSNTGTGNWVGASVGLWAKSTKEPITTVTLLSGSGTLSAGSTFTLYGIANADIGAYATGGIITQDSTYYYHAFGSSGTFTPKQNLSCDVLVIAGGGGGSAGGGGAGGLRLLSSQSFASATPYVATIGNGGAYSITAVGGNGTNSSIIGGSISISATGGGGGSYSASSTTGGSGGGAALSGAGPSPAGTGNAGSYTPVEGYNGGSNSIYTSPYPGAGGGGAGGLGGNTISSTVAGAGGVGAGGTSYTNYSILDSMASATGTGVLSSGHYYYAGGGGGGLYATGTVGAGGLGGGGAGTCTIGVPAVSGTPNTGGGGGGFGGNNAGTYTAGGSGGAGLIIVRYAK